MVDVSNELCPFSCYSNTHKILRKKTCWFSLTWLIQLKFYVIWKFDIFLGTKSIYKMVLMTFQTKFIPVKNLLGQKKKVLFPIPRPSQKNSADSTKIFSNFWKKHFIWVIFGSAMVPTKNKMAALRGTAPRSCLNTMFSLGNQHIFGKRSESWRLNVDGSFST